MLYLLADSRTLFGEEPITAHAMSEIASSSPTAAYLGASNDDEPAYYEMFRGAMAKVGIEATTHVPANPSAAELRRLEAADLVVLAGGSPAVGWRSFTSSGVAAALRQLHARNTPLIGISAGAIQLSRGYFDDDGTWWPMFGWVPALVDAHREADDWLRLRDALTRCRDSDSAPGIGLETGSALVWDAAAGSPVAAIGTIVELAGPKAAPRPMQLPLPR